MLDAVQLEKLIDTLINKILRFGLIPLHILKHSELTLRQLKLLLARFYKDIGRLFERELLTLKVVNFELHLLGLFSELR